VKESPHRESLLVLEQSLGKHLKRTLMLVAINLLQRDTVTLEQGVEEILKGRALESLLYYLGYFTMLRKHLEKMLAA